MHLKWKPSTEYLNSTEIMKAEVSLSLVSLPGNDFKTFKENISSAATRPRTAHTGSAV